MTFPAVFYSIKWALPPVVVTNQQEADRLDPAEWANLAAPKEAAAPYPKIFANVNMLPRIVVSPDQEDNLTAEWRDYTSYAVAVAQARPPDVPPVTINPIQADVQVNSFSGSFTVTMTGEGLSGTWIATKDAAADWLTFSPDTPQSADGDVEYSVMPNIGPARTAHIYVNGKTFTINQDGI
jgi:all-beta uncharacterized protein